MTTLRAVAAPLLFALAVGCGGGPAIVPVSGRVTLNGKPLPNAGVSFQPTGGDPTTAGPGSVGTTDADGRFALAVLRGGGPGAAVGRHRVMVSASSSPGTGPTKDEVATAPGEVGRELVPARYNAESELTFDVPAGGTDAANFDLKSP